MSYGFTDEEGKGEDRAHAAQGQVLRNGVPLRVTILTLIWLYQMEVQGRDEVIVLVKTKLLRNSRKFPAC